ncbi:MAG: MBL fold metallo-hydrolase [Calditrichaeota bacterium]|nr:MBL fold metallo-hydrolase [Calditrichota bacterium]
MAEEARIKILVEETVRRAHLIAEHGLSILIEFRGQKILFDTGQFKALFWNAPQLGVDLKKLDAVVLSHGHYDHTGGLAELIDQRGAVPVFAHPDVFQKRFHVTETSSREIGMPWNRDTLEAKGARFHLNRNLTEIFPDVFTTGEIPRENDFEIIEKGFQIQKGAGFSRDAIRDDQALVLKTQKGLVVILGCGHSGVVNTLSAVGRAFGTTRFYAILGGFHLVRASEHRIHQTIGALRELSFDIISPMHCTGFRARAELYKAFPEKFRDWHVGDTGSFG